MYFNFYVYFDGLLVYLVMCTKYSRVHRVGRSVYPHKKIMKFNSTVNNTLKPLKTYRLIIYTYLRLTGDLLRLREELLRRLQNNKLKKNLTLMAWVHSDVFSEPLRADLHLWKTRRV